MTAPSLISSAASRGPDHGPLRADSFAMYLCGASFFIQFVAMAFASFPLQTHLRRLMDPSSASLIAGLIPIAACMTYFFFHFAESVGWTRFPQRLLGGVALMLAVFQCLLGWQLNRIDPGTWILGPAADAGACLFLMGCANSSCMVLLNHIAVATLSRFAYVVRAAGSTGYMLGVILLGMLGSDEGTIANHHLFVASAASVLHAAIALSGAWILGNKTRDALGHSPQKASTGIIGRTAETPDKARSSLAWWGLMALVWMVAMCEMSYSLYSHEFVTKHYGTLGYYLFAGGIAIEIGLLLVVPQIPRLQKSLLFLGPLGWMLLFLGGLIALGGMPPLGMLTLAMALNCPFQTSVHLHAHEIDSRVLGIASVTLAQSIGYLSAAVLSAMVSMPQSGPRNLWLCMIPVASLAMMLAVWKLVRGSMTPEASTLERETPS